MLLNRNRYFVEIVTCLHILPAIIMIYAINIVHVHSNKYFTWSSCFGWPAWLTHTKLHCDRTFFAVSSQQGLHVVNNIHRKETGYRVHIRVSFLMVSGNFSWSRITLATKLLSSNENMQILLHPWFNITHAFIIQWKLIRAR